MSEDLKASGLIGEIRGCVKHVCVGHISPNADIAVKKFETPHAEHLDKDMKPTMKWSAYWKCPVKGPVRLTLAGLRGDEHSSRSHVTEERALSQNDQANLDALEEQFTTNFQPPTALGENIISVGKMNQKTVCIGDVYRMGSATVKVTQPRHPCVKNDRNHGATGVSLAINEQARGGWLYRVLEPGDVCEGDDIVLLERPLPQWTVERCVLLLYGKDAQSSSYRELKEMSELEELAEHRWRKESRKRAQQLQAQVEGAEFKSKVIHVSATLCVVAIVAYVGYRVTKRQ